MIEQYLSVPDVPVIGHVSLTQDQWEPSPGWVPADGRALKITEYEELFQKYGFQYGRQDDEHFLIPEMSLTPFPGSAYFVYVGINA